ncbi:MAG: 5-methyltetrahydropteroyltriglutamate--homocysteine S-methyltransferase [Candidatus Vidania fulgoroideorum]
MKILNHLIGLPLIDEKREIKFITEKYIQKNYKKKIYKKVKKVFRKNLIKNIKIQKRLNFTILGNYLCIDKMLYTMINLGILPKRFLNLKKKINFKNILKIIKGTKKNKPLNMTKWFNTNYHYYIPEINKKSFTNKIGKLAKKEIKQIKNIKIKNQIKFPIIGPITFEKLSKWNKKKKYNYKKKLIKSYIKFINKIKKFFKKRKIYIQIEEPIIKNIIKNKKIIKEKYKIYKKLKKYKKELFFITYFYNINKQIIKFVNKIRFYVVHIELTSNINKKIKLLKKINKKIYISIGIIDSKNIWINNFEKSIKIINKFKKRKKIFISTSTSLIHVPINKKKEKNSKIYEYIAFCREKIKEIINIKKLFKKSNNKKINLNKYKIYLKNNINNKKLENLEKPKITKKHIKKINLLLKIKRKIIKKKEIGIKNLITTTTIGSFPQNKKIRKIRRKYYLKKINFYKYNQEINKFIHKNLKIQIKNKINVLVNGEPERSDMVEYFCKNYKGIYITKNGWVQSYCTRCIKPPIIYGKIKRKNNDIKNWYFNFKNIKGIVTGPITILKWSFIRKLKKKKIIYLYNIAKCISKDVKELYKIGIKIIQIDEPALKEAMPNEKKKINKYLKLINFSFKMCCLNILEKKIQIHSHICYSSINKKNSKIFRNLTIDVISIESSKNIKKTIKTIKNDKFLNKIEIGFGIYNVHSKIIPNNKEIYKKINLITKKINKKKIWINPDCGLKTRKYKEIKKFMKELKKAINNINSYLIM